MKSDGSGILQKNYACIRSSLNTSVARRLWGTRAHLKSSGILFDYASYRMISSNDNPKYSSSLLLWVTALPCAQVSAESARIVKLNGVYRMWRFVAVTMKNAVFWGVLVW
jgi:hypothetical protein